MFRNSENRFSCDVAQNIQEWWQQERNSTEADTQHDHLNSIYLWPEIYKSYETLNVGLAKMVLVTFESKWD